MAIVFLEFDGVLNRRTTEAPGDPGDSGIRTEAGCTAALGHLQGRN